MEIPFVPFNVQPESLEQLMVFDREACKVFKKFKRPVSRFDAPPDVIESGATVFTPDGILIVVEVSAGVRIRIPESFADELRESQ